MDDSSNLVIKGRVWSDEEIVGAERVAADILGSYYADAGGPKRLSADEYIALSKNGDIEMYRLDAATSAVMGMAERFYEIVKDLSTGFLLSGKDMTWIGVRGNVATADGARYVGAAVRSMFGPVCYAPVDVPADRCGASCDAFSVQISDGDAGSVLSFIRTAVPRPDEPSSASLQPIERLLEEIVDGKRKTRALGWADDARRTDTRGWVPAAASASFLGFVEAAGPSASTKPRDIAAARSLAGKLRTAMWQFEISGQSQPEVLFSLTAAQSTALSVMPGRLIPVMGWKAMEAFMIACGDKEVRGSRRMWRMSASLARWVVATIGELHMPDHTLSRARSVVAEAIRMGDVR